MAGTAEDQGPLCKRPGPNAPPDVAAPQARQGPHGEHQTPCPLRTQPAPLTLGCAPQGLTGHPTSPAYTQLAGWPWLGALRQDVTVCRAWRTSGHLACAVRGAVSSRLRPAEVTQPVVADGRPSATPPAGRPLPWHLWVGLQAPLRASAGPSSPHSQGVPQATWWTVPLPSSWVSSSGDSPRNCPQGLSSPHTSTPLPWLGGRDPVSLLQPGSSVPTRCAPCCSPDSAPGTQCHPHRQAEGHPPLPSIRPKPSPALAAYPPVASQTSPKRP